MPEKVLKKRKVDSAPLSLGAGYLTKPALPHFISDGFKNLLAISSHLGIKTSKRGIWPRRSNRFVSASDV